MNGHPSARIWCGRAVVLVCWVGCVLGRAAGPAGAQSADILVRVERTPNEQTLAESANWVPVTVTIVDRATQAPPTDDYNVVALASNTAGEETEAYGCGQRSDNNVGVPKGIYDCVVIVDHGGLWTFHGVVNSVPTGNQPKVNLARGSFDLNVEAGTLAGLAPDENAIKGSTKEVVLLQLHSLFGALWALCVLMLMAVALPLVRRSVASRVLHRLEDHLGLVTRCAGAATALVIGTGIYLLLNQAAYETPWSPSAVRGVFGLPYGKPYFLSMFVKVGAYLLMVLAILPLVTEARRRSRLASESEEGVRRRAARTGRPPSPWDTPWQGPLAGSGGAVATLQAPAAAVAHRRPPGRRERPAGAVLARGATVVMVAGGAAIAVCVTLLKYFHEFIEASRAVIR